MSKGQKYTPEQRDAQRARVRAHYKANQQYYKDKARSRGKELKAQNRALVIEYLREHPCVDCGNSDIEVLQFDHRDPVEKSFSLGADALRLKWARVMEEISKCDIRCANCHIKRSRRQFGWWTDEMPS